ncbi:MAG: carboxymuconolactone decarboxylase family protein [Gemmatimonadota bacterium]
MTWIRTIPFPEATGRLRKLYERIAGPDGQLDNIMRAHSLRPHSMEGHMSLYKNVLHHSGNRLPEWFLETLGVYVSMLNDCAYCVEHHAAGLRRLLNDDERTDDIRAALESESFDDTFNAAEACALAYARRLTRDPAGVTELMIEKLRSVGYDDGEILEINQVCAYFSYANRTVLGLGCETDGEVLGLSPGAADDPGDWSHR